jgi:hypothetical protein
LGEVSDYEKLIVRNMEVWQRVRVVDDHAFEIARERAAGKRDENQRENSKKIFHEAGGFDVSKHAILNMRSRAVSSSGADFSGSHGPKQIDPLSRIC